MEFASSRLDGAVVEKKSRGSNCHRDSPAFHPVSCSAVPHDEGTISLMQLASVRRARQTRRGNFHTFLCSPIHHRCVTASFAMLGDLISRNPARYRFAGPRVIERHSTEAPEIPTFGSFLSTASRRCRHRRIESSSAILSICFDLK